MQAIAVAMPGDFVSEAQCDVLEMLDEWYGPDQLHEGRRH